MKHHTLTLSHRRPSFGLHAHLVRGFFALATLISVSLGQGTARAGENVSLAFVLGPGSQLVVGKEAVPLPEGARLELLVSGEKSDGRFPMQVRPGGLVLPDFALGESGRRLRVRLAEPSAGWLTPRAEGLDADLSLTVEVELEDGAAGGSGVYALALTTGPVEAAPSGDTGVVPASGAPIDRAAHSARFIASGTVAADSPIAAGEPLVVVLEGTFEGIPAQLR